MNAEHKKMFDDENKLIAYLVEKVTKGVRKQLKGYVQRTQEDIEWSKRSVDSRIEEFNRLCEINRDMQKEWEVVKIMLEENARMKKMIAEMRILHEQVRNELMDMRLFQVELKQELKVHMLSQH